MAAPTQTEPRIVVFIYKTHTLFHENSKTPIFRQIKLNSTETDDYSKGPLNVEIDFHEECPVNRKIHLNLKIRIYLLKEIVSSYTKTCVESL